MNEFSRSIYITIWLWLVSLPKSVLWMFCVTTGIKEDSRNWVGNWERCSRCRHFPFRDCLKTTQLLPPVVQYLYYLLPYRLAEWLTDSFTSLFLLGSIVITNEAIKTRAVKRAFWFRCVRLLRMWPSCFTTPTLDSIIDSIPCIASLPVSPLHLLSFLSSSFFSNCLRNQFDNVRTNWSGVEQDLMSKVDSFSLSCKRNPCAIWRCSVTHLPIFSGTFQRQLFVL
jgi:hypothetical protein